MAQRVAAPLRFGAGVLSCADLSPLSRTRAYHRSHCDLIRAKFALNEARSTCFVFLLFRVSRGNAAERELRERSPQHRDQGNLGKGNLGAGVARGTRTSLFFLSAASCSFFSILMTADADTNLSMSTATLTCASILGAHTRETDCACVTRALMRVSQR